MKLPLSKKFRNSGKLFLLLYLLIGAGCSGGEGDDLFGDAPSQAATRNFKVSIDAGANPGDRFVIAKIGDSYQVGLVGIGVIENGTSPSGFAKKYPHHQVLEGATYTDHNPYYWLPGGVESSSKVKSKKIQVKISSQIWSEESQSLVATPAWLIQKVTNSLLLWESVPETPFYFEMAGTYDASGTRPTGTVAQPLLTVDFTKKGDEHFPGGVGGLGTFNEAPDNSAIPNSYSGGHVLFNMTSYFSFDYNTDLYFHNTFYRILVHEIGHALGLYHSATNSSVMTCGTSAIGDTNDYLFLSDQDKADITYGWNPSAANSYSISGTVDKDSFGGSMMVYAVNTVTGKTYSTLTASETYAIAIREAGTYVVVAKNDDHSPTYTNVFLPTWYASGTTGVLSPEAATSIVINSTTKHVTGIDIDAVAGTGFFNLFLAFLPTLGTEESGQALLWPSQAKDLIFYFHNATVDVNSAEISEFGSSPDYSITSN